MRMERIPWYEAAKLALIAAGVAIAWMLYRRLSETAGNVDKATPALASLGSGGGNLLDSIGNLIAGR